MYKRTPGSARGCGATSFPRPARPPWSRSSRPWLLLLMLLLLVVVVAVAVAVVVVVVVVVVVLLLLLV